MFLYIQRVTHEEASVLKLVWRDADGDEETYTVDAETVILASESVRTCLKEMSDNYGRDDQTSLGERVQRLAEAGYVLRRVLLNPIADGRKHDVSEIDNWIKETVSKKGSELRVHIGAETCLPIGCLHENGPIEHQTADELNEGFWGKKLQISYIFSNPGIGKLSNPVPIETFRLVSGLNAEELELVRRQLGEEDKKILERVLNLPLKPAYLQRGLFERVEQAMEHNTMLHLFGHWNENKLILANGDELDLAKLALLTRDLANGGNDEGSYNFLFLNACGTSVGEIGRALLNNCSIPGMYGMVGTEAPINALFALRYACSFILLIVEAGCTPSEAIYRLRSEHWPYSILYSSYVHPRLRWS